MPGTRKTDPALTADQQAVLREIRGQVAKLCSYQANTGMQGFHATQHIHRFTLRHIADHAPKPWCLYAQAALGASHD